MRVGAPGATPRCYFNSIWNFRSTARRLNLNELARLATANDLATPAKDDEADLVSQRGIAEVVEFIAGFPDGAFQSDGGKRGEAKDKQTGDKQETQGAKTCSFHGT